MTNPDNEREVLLCPFCGVHVVETGRGFAVHHRAGCFAGIKGSTYFLPHELNAWNTRAALPTDREARLAAALRATANELGNVLGLVRSLTGMADLQNKVLDEANQTLSSLPEPPKREVGGYLVPDNKNNWWELYETWRTKWGFEANRGDLARGFLAGYQVALQPKQKEMGAEDK